MNFSIWLVLTVVVIIIVMYVISTYNGLIKSRNWIDEAWSQIDVQLKRRFDLIPNVVETVKGYAAHEKETLERVIQARNAMLTGSPQERIDADNQLQASLKSIFALSEGYPDLKANQNFIQLQEELVNTENKVAYSRQLYNKTVVDYNIRREKFPANMLANAFGFTHRPQLSIPEVEKVVPPVKF
jgi:LemA protein